MIDFRYHLVSIASIFLALAVGIVLGAGPLKGTIGDTLASEVTRLRDDANNLRADLSTAEAQAAAREEILIELRPRAVSGLLTGQSVSMLVLPGAADSAVAEVRLSLLEAGASVSTLTSLDPSFTSGDPPNAADRTAAAAELREAFASDLPVGASAEEVITVALGWALASKPPAGDTEDGSSGPQTDSPTDTPVDPGTDGDSSNSGSESAGDAGTGAGTGAEPGTGAGDGSASDGADVSDDLTPGVNPDQQPGGLQADALGRQILDILAAHGLLSHASDGLLGDSDGIVVVAPEADEVAAEDVTGWTDLIASLNEETAITVVGAVGVDVVLESNLIATIRDDGALSGGISTIDNIDSPIGRVAVPFVVGAEVTGSTGHYGDLDSAAQTFPAVPVAER